jgi:endoglucanase
VHLQDRTSERKPPKIEDLFIDCGFTDAAQAAQAAPIGTPITLASTFTRLGTALATSRVFDNRIGIFSAAETLRRVAKHRKKLRVRLVALSTVQEEIGTVGAEFATRTIDPDIALCVDVCHGTDVPGINQAKYGKVTLGGGPTVTHGTANHPLLVRRLVETARRWGIPLQHEASSRFTGTDTDAIYRATRGIPSALVSLPTRYMHTPSEVIHLGDLEHLVQLLTHTVLDLKPGDQFMAVPV